MPSKAPEGQGVQRTPLPAPPKPVPIQITLRVDATGDGIIRYFHRLVERLQADDRVTATELTARVVKE